MNLPEHIEHIYTKQYQKSPGATAVKPVGSCKARRLVLFFVIKQNILQRSTYPLIDIDLSRTRTRTRLHQTMKNNCVHNEIKKLPDNLKGFSPFSVLHPEETIAGAEKIMKLYISSCLLLEALVLPKKQKQKTTIYYQLVTLL